MSTTRFAICTRLVALLLPFHAGAAPAGQREVIVHVQILKDDHIIEDVTLQANQGTAAGACFGAALAPAETAAPRRITCNGLRFTFTPRELREDVIHASFAVEYYRPLKQEGAAAPRFEGFSFAASPAMTPGTPIVAGPPPYTLRLSARY